jgi:predicted metal-dependent peptidase
MSAEVLIQKAKVQLVLHQPFFASIVCNRKIQITEAPNYTASINAAGMITMGRKFVEGLNVQQVVFLLAHETMHYAMLHFMRRGWRKHKPFNIACDKVINDILKESHVGQSIPDGTYQDGAREFTAEQLYNENENENDGGGGGEYAPGEGNCDIDETGMPEDVQKVLDQIKQELAGASQAAKAVGKLPAGLSRLVDEIINPPTPWQQLLDRWMTQYIKADITWSKPRRNLMEVGYFPTAGRKPHLNAVGIIADSSGSISSEIPHFVGHLNAIIEKCSPEKVYFLHVDATVHQIDEFGVEDLPINIKAIQGGGGTDMGAGIRWFQDEGIELDVCVVLTDGYTPWPAAAPEFPLAVLCTTDQAAPEYAELIPYQMEAA